MKLSSENDYLHGFVTYKKLNAEFNHFREKAHQTNMIDGEEMPFPIWTL